ERRGAGQRGAEDGEADLAEVAADEDGQGLAHRLPHGPAFDEGGDDGLEPVVGDDEVGGGARGGGAAAAEGDRDVGQPDGRGVVGAVARHGDDLVEALEGLDNPNLVGWRAAGHDGDLRHQLIQVVVVEGVEIGTGDDPVPV